MFFRFPRKWRCRSGLCFSMTTRCFLLIDPQLASRLLSLSIRFMNTLHSLIERHAIPPTLLSLPPHLAAPRPSNDLDRSTTPQVGRATPIIPVFTSRPRPLSTYLRSKGMNARPITWPTVPKGLDRVRVCVHSSNTEEEIDMLAREMIEWARGEMASVEVQAQVEMKQGPPLTLLSKL